VAIDRMEIDSQLAEIQARRSILFDQQRSSTYPEAEFYEKLKRLDSEEKYWRTRLAEVENPPPASLPDWGNRLWKVVESLQLDVDAWRDERRAERIADAIERDKARRLQYALMILLVLAVGFDAAIRAVGV